MCVCVWWGGGGGGEGGEARERGSPGAREPGSPGAREPGSLGALKIFAVEPGAPSFRCLKP